MPSIPQDFILEQIFSSEGGGEYPLIRKGIRKILANITHQDINEFENAEEFPDPSVKKMAEHGFMGMIIPKEYGGAGLNNLAAAICIEEMARVWASLALIVSAHNFLCCRPISVFGTEEQKQKYLPAMASGKLIGCFALTEAEAGSDIKGIKTSAKKVEFGYLINGSKRFITNATKAGICILAARTKDSPSQDISMFIVDTSTPGFLVTRVEKKKYGLHASYTCELVFEDLWVPKASLLGREEDGFDPIIKDTLLNGRISIAAQGLGIAQGAFELALDYVYQRKQFGEPLIKLSGIGEMMANMATQLSAIRLLVYKAARLRDLGKPAVAAASMAKLFAAEAGFNVVYNAQQIFGGQGLMHDCPIERFARDMRFIGIYEGTSQIQQQIIKKNIQNEFPWSLY